MCLAIPGKISDMYKKDGNEEVIVEYPGEKRIARNVGLSLRKGDYVIVQAKIVVQRVPEEDALESLKAWREAGKRI